MRVWIRTFGCRANQYDSEMVRAIVTGAGGSVVDRPSDADVAVFNSCAVTADAEADLRQAVRRFERDRGSAARSVVMGCAAARAGRELAVLPSVSHVVGGADADEIARALGVALARDVRTTAQGATRAVLRIQDGCDEHCTFCATTLARGANRSRPADQLLAEAARLAEHHPEIVLTGVHIGTYGRDLGTTLGALVGALIDAVPTTRFRLTSVEATEVDDALAERLRADPRRLAPHLHAPLQSGSDRVLKRMGRHWYTSGAYTRAIEGITGGRDAFALGADVISGFPGESDGDHARTVELVRALPFTYLHVFPYSPRPGTAAERLDDQVAPARARERAAELRAIGAAKEAAHRSRRAGAEADVVVVGNGARREGLTEDYLSVALADERIPRGTRFGARLGIGAAGQLVAAELPVIGRW